MQRISATQTAFVGAALAIVGMSSGCGLETLFAASTHEAHDRPASKVTASSVLGAAAPIEIIDVNGDVVAPFETAAVGDTFEFKLPSFSYQMLTVRATAGDATLRSVISSLEPESEAAPVTLDAQTVAETLIIEARMARDKLQLRKLEPAVFEDARNLIRQSFAQAGSPASVFLGYIERILPEVDTESLPLRPYMFTVPEYQHERQACTSGEDGCANDGLTIQEIPVLTVGPLNGKWLSDRGGFEYAGDGVQRTEVVTFNRALDAAAAIPEFDPSGCDKPMYLRTVFAVDFNEGRKDGRCAEITNKKLFLWTADEPGKSMFFVGWVHADSPIQDPRIDQLMGASVPNQVPMYDDGTNGDEVAGDNIYTVYFDLPSTLRVGYKYTWGFPGQSWTGSEEWPGNSRVLEVDDKNGDKFVYRYDEFADESSNKDRSGGRGNVGWSTDFEDDGYLEVHEQPIDVNNNCVLEKEGAEKEDYFTPTTIGPAKVPCSTLR